MSRTALGARSVGVASGAARMVFLSCLSMSLLQILGSGPRADPPVTSSAANESDELPINLVLVRRAHAVRRTLVDFELCAAHDLADQQVRGADRHDLVVVTVQKA